MRILASIAMLTILTALDAPLASAAPGTTTPLFRLLNSRTGDYFYTTSVLERDGAIASFGYQTEGIACYVFDSQVPGTTPLFRLLNPQTGDHFYTTSVSERDSAIASSGYQSDGIACYVFDSEAPGTTPLFRLLSTQTGHHFYTTSKAELEKAILRLGYKDEGIACQVFGSGPSGVVVPPPPPSLARLQDEFDRDLTRPASGPLCLPLHQADVERCLNGQNDDAYPSTCPADTKDGVHSYNFQVVCDKVSEKHQPRTANEVQNLVRSAAARGKRVRAVGNQHSANTTLCTDGIILEMGKNFARLPQASDIQDFEGVKTVAVDPGVKLHDVAKFLDDNGWSLGFVNPGFRLPTMAGAVATGTHGSSTTHTAVVSNIVQSMTVVLADGTMKEFSKGTTGQTDPDLWKALTVNNGFLGVVVKMRVKVEPRFNLKVVTKMHYKSDDLLEKGPHALLGNCDWGQIVWFPVANQPWLGRVWTLCGTKTNEPRQKTENHLLDPPLSDSLRGRSDLQQAACGRSLVDTCFIELARTDRIRDYPSYAPFVGQSCVGGNCGDVVGAPYLMMSSAIEMGDIEHPRGGFTQRDWEIAIPKQNAQAALKDAFERFKTEKMCLPLIGVFIRFAPRGGQEAVDCPERAARSLRA